MKLVLATIFCFVIGLVNSDCSAQNNIDVKSKIDEQNMIYTNDKVPTDIKRRNDLNVMNGSWTTIKSEQLSTMPTQNISKIVNTAPGVNSVGNEAPRIRGAEPSGTAYFVDGVRVYGTLPNGMKIPH